MKREENLKHGTKKVCVIVDELMYSDDEECKKRLEEK